MQRLNHLFIIIVAAAFLPETAAFAQEMPIASGAVSTLREEMVLPPEVKFALLTLGGGGLAGWAVGYTLKKFAKIAALIVGVSFISLQMLAFHKFITIDWDAIKNAVPDETLEQSATSLMSVVTYNLPFAGSFVVGFWLGFRKG